MRIGQLEVDLEKLAGFLARAKRNGYAGGIGRVREADGSKTFTYQNGDFHYTDNYAGSYQAPGQEIVRWQREDGQRIWQMAYSGGMLPEFWGNDSLANQTYAFLKIVLMGVSPELPFRGPEAYKSGDLVYLIRFKNKSNIERFAGDEKILTVKKKKVIFSQDFIGGLVIPR